MGREEAARLRDRVLEHHKNGDGAAALALLDRILASYPIIAALHVQRGTRTRKRFESFERFQTGAVIASKAPICLYGLNERPWQPP